MGDDLNLQEYANAIEGTIVALDVGELRPVTDREAISGLELLLDKYYFKDTSPGISNARMKQLFSTLVQTVETSLEGLEDEFIAKVISTIHFVAKRRSDGKRSYVEFIQQYVGVRLGPGTRIMNIPKH
jgi:hypothetical protein